ncbi:cupin domain-containing protein [Ruegeria arenilitoris]|uniref:cupin domain-containing protein n=1 Tax=Ruegeria arenilitoris TaxID=1173585 RepID=UPI0014805355|nr:cupin domain-containing protein [Ruegeria arenilitoris]
MEQTSGITKVGAGLEDVEWNVLGQIYVPKVYCDNLFMWEATLPSGAFVPPHIHPTQDEFIMVLEGEFQVDFGFEEGNVKPNVAKPGDTVRMPMGVAHGVYNRSDKPAKCIFAVSPTRKLYDLFVALDGLTDLDEFKRLGELHENSFLEVEPNP